MFRRVRLLTCAAILSMPVVLGTQALGAECDGVQFPDSVKVANTDLVLNGMGLRKATFLEVKVYVAGLYLPKKSGDGGQIASANEPWQLALHFVHDVDASEMRDAFEDGFKKAAGDKLGGLRQRIDALNAQMVDLKEGQILSYAYDPTKGTVVDVNGKSGAVIDGADFASALLTISVGPEPPNEELKSGLLGGECK